MCPTVRGDHGAFALQPVSMAEVEESGEENGRVRFMIDSDAVDSDESVHGRLSSTDSISSLTPDRDGSASGFRPTAGVNGTAKKPGSAEMTDEEYDRTAR